MKIWLDDNHTGYRPAPDGWVHVHTLAELRALLEKTRGDGRIEAMSFDNDLGPGEPEGYTIAKWLARFHLDRWPMVLTVHSANTVTAPLLRSYAAQIDRFRESLLRERTQAPWT